MTHKEYYKKNKEGIKEKILAYRTNNRAWYLAYRAKWQRTKQGKLREEARIIIRAAKNKPCADCDKKYPHYVMDFDHVRGKKSFTVGRILSRPNIRALKREIKKCEIVCSNCHRERTHGAD